MRLKNLAMMGLRSLAHRVAGRRCPTNVMLAVTNRCNARCRYCNIPARPQHEISTGGSLRLIDEMRAAGTVRLGLWGGEPLLRDDIGALISHAHRAGLYVTLDTNGLLLRKRIGELADLDHLVISLDGDLAAHEANRGAGTFAKVMDAIELAASARRRRIWLLTVLTRENLNDIDFLLNTAKRLKIHCAFQVLHHSDVLGRDHHAMIPGNEEYKEAIRHIIRRKREGARICSSFRYLNYLLHWEDYAVRSKATPHLALTCKAGRMYCNIDADGKVYGCSLLVGRAPALNALEVGFKKAFAAIPPVPCHGCTAACYTEYNYLYDLDVATIREWIRTTRR